MSVVTDATQQTAISPGSGTDDAVAINAALNDPTTSTVQLLAGAFSTATTIIVPSGKTLLGAGRGATIITRMNADVTEPGFGPALVRMADASIGVRIADLTLVAPKTANKVQGVHAFDSTNFIVERVNAYNMGYAFWAQQLSQYGIFRDCASWNANVHFEATQAYDILFDNIVSGDGDGDNPLGVEAVWHCLLASRRITFRHARHTGKGQPFLVVANDINGDPQGGLIDDILYDDCYAVTTDGKIALLLTNYNNLPVGRVELRDSGADVAAGGVLASIQHGTVIMSGGRWRSTAQENFDISSAASLSWDNPDVTVSPPDTTTARGNVFNAGGDVRITGGAFTINSPIVTLGVGNLEASSTTRIVRPGLDRIYDPALGMPITYSFDADYVMTTDHVVGNDAYYPVSGLPRFTIIPTAGGRYRIRFRGLIQKTDSNLYMRVYVDPAANIDWTKSYGFTKLQKADGGFQINDPNAGIRFAQVSDCTLNTVRQFEMDLTFLTSGSQIDVKIGADGTKMLAGAEVIIERLAS